MLIIISPKISVLRSTNEVLGFHEVHNLTEDPMSKSSPQVQELDSKKTKQGRGFCALNTRGELH